MFLLINFSICKSDIKVDCLTNRNCIQNTLIKALKYKKPLEKSARFLQTRSKGHFANTSIYYYINPSF